MYSLLPLREKGLEPAPYDGVDVLVVVTVVVVVVLVALAAWW